jgi:hypothetical protein
MGQRDVIIVVIGVAIATIQAIGMTVYAVNTYLDNSDDPLVKQGGLKPEQDIRKQ